MRQFFFFLFTLLCAGVTQGQDDTDAALAAYLQSISKAPAATTEAELNLDPYLDTDAKPAGTSDKDSEVDEPVTECKTESDEDGVCVTYYLCELGTSTIIEDGHTLIDTRSISECPKVLDTCCLQNQVSNSSKATIIEKEKFLDTPEDATNSSPSDKLAPSSADRPPVTAGKCGFSNPGVNLIAVRDGSSPSNRVYADFGEFPWMVAILKSSMTDVWDKSNYIGGGSLIHPSVVMTVAHKVVKKKANEIKIRAGEYETNSEEELYEHQERNVNRIVVHPNFFRPSLYNDVALLFLDAPVNLVDGPQIGIGCLSPQLPPPGTTCYSMGWGSENFANKRIYASILKKVKVPLVGKTTCEGNLRKTRLGKIFKLHQSLVCAGGEDGIDTCRGDGGSSLVCPLDNKESRFAIYGMVAYGIGCGGKDIPGVYVNVPNSYDWINQQLTAEGLDPKSYNI